MMIGSIGLYGNVAAYRGKGRDGQRAGETRGADRFGAGYEEKAAENASAGKAPDMWNVTCSSNNLVLHGTDTADGEVVTAWVNVAAGTSMTVYRPDGFDSQHPVYKVKMWEESGKVTECMVDIEKVDPTKCNALEMYAYSAHLSSSGEYPGALERFLMAQAHQRDSISGYSGKNLLDKTDWLKVLEKVMQMQSQVGNLQGYLDYKGFHDFLSKKAAQGQAGDGKGKTEKESQVDANVQVKADGSRILVMTRRLGGMATTTSVEISKPTKLPNEGKGQEEIGKAGDTGKGEGTDGMGEEQGK